jgi:zinc protease
MRKVSMTLIFSLFNFLLMFFLISSCSLNPKISSHENDLKKNSDLDIILDVEKRILPNGLTVILANRGILPIYSLHLFYKVGSRYESPGITGASHFLEHLMFKGAKKYGPSQFDQLVEGQGGQNNAYTSKDLTVYYENMPLETLNSILDLEADRMANLLLELDAFEQERKVILEERKLRYENSPNGQLFMNLEKTLFSGTNYSASTIGDIKDIKSVTRDQIRDYFKLFYQPSNAILVLSGAFNTAEEKLKAFEEIEKTMGTVTVDEKNLKRLENWKNEKNDPKNYQLKSPKQNKIFLKGNNNIPLFVVAYPADKAGTKNSQVLDLLSSVLGQGNSAHLVQKWVQNEKPLLSSVTAGNYNLQYAGVFMVSGELLNGIKPNKIIKEYEKSKKTFCAESINERSLQKAKNQYLFGYYELFDTNSGLAHLLGLNEAYFSDYKYFLSELEQLKTIGVEEVKLACDKIFSSKKEKGTWLFIGDKLN